MTISVFGKAVSTARTRTVVRKPEQKRPKGWIGVDLDGTLAVYDRWKALTHIGEPVPAVVAKIKEKLNEGYEVKIFTARICELDPQRKAEFERAIARWTSLYIGEQLFCTCVKDHKMIELWDDRAVTVEKNTGRMGRFIDGSLQEL